jgi:hypothetical protein
MSISSSQIYVGWPIPIGLKVSKERSGPVAHKATFSWDDILDSSMNDPSGGGFHSREWRVMINNKSYIVKNNPIFTIQVPLGCGQTCVKVQTIYDLSSVEYEFGNLATSEFCDEVCITNDKDKYCENPNINNNVKTANSGSARMRYARAINGGAAAFR